GLDYYRKDPNTIYAIIDCAQIGMGPPPVWLGINVQDAVEGGVKVTGVEANSPAAKADIKMGDVVSAIDKKPIKDRAALTEVTEGHKVGDKLTLSVKRDKDTKDIVVTLEERPPQGAPPRVYLGFQADPAEGGLRVSSVTA